MMDANATKNDLLQQLVSHLAGSRIQRPLLRLIPDIAAAHASWHTPAALSQQVRCRLLCPFAGAAACIVMPLKGQVPRGHAGNRSFLEALRIPSGHVAVALPAEDQGGLSLAVFRNDS